MAATHPLWRDEGPVPWHRDRPLSVQPLSDGRLLLRLVGPLPRLVGPLLRQLGPFLRLHSPLLREVGPFLRLLSLLLRLVRAFLFLLVSPFLREVGPFLRLLSVLLRPLGLLLRADSQFPRQGSRLLGAVGRLPGRLQERAKLAGLILGERYLGRPRSSPGRPAESRRSGKTRRCRCGGHWRHGWHGWYRRH